MHLPRSADNSGLNLFCDWWPRATGMLGLGWKSVNDGMKVWMVVLLDLMVGIGVEILTVVSKDKNLMLSNLFPPRPNF